MREGAPDPIAAETKVVLWFVPRHGVSGAEGDAAMIAAIKSRLRDALWILFTGRTWREHFRAGSSWERLKAAIDEDERAQQDALDFWERHTVDEAVRIERWKRDPYRRN